MSVPKYLLQQFFIGIVAFISLSAGQGLAQNAVPMLVNYQGELRDPTTGEAVPDDDYDMVFRIYDVHFGGTPLWEESYLAEDNITVPVRDGTFTVVLGSGVGDPLDATVFNGADRWLEVQVEGETLDPRQRLTSVAYSIVSENSRLLDGQEASAFAPAAHTHSGQEVTAGTILEARIDPAVARDSEIITMVLASDGSGSGLDADTVDGLDSSDLISSSVDYGRSGVASDLYEDTETLTDKYVNSAGPERIEGSSDTQMLFLLNEGTGCALNARAPNSDYAIRGYSSKGGGYGVYGLGHGYSGYGVVGFSSGERGCGVWGSAAGEYGKAVRGTANETGDVENYGGHFEADGDWGYGVWSAAAGQHGVGVQGWAHYSGDVKNHGGYFVAAGGMGRGVTGSASNTGDVANHGGYFQASGGAGRGATCIATGSMGIGVYAEGTRAGVYSQGDVEVTGNVEVTGDVDVTGDLVVSGAYRGSIGPHGGAPFPRPAYDSGWREIPEGIQYTLNHNLGGDPDDYVIDLQFLNTSAEPNKGRHQMHYGGYLGFNVQGQVTVRQGAWWHNLTHEAITVSRDNSDGYADQFRVRIWVYN